MKRKTAVAAGMLVASLGLGLAAIVLGPDRAPETPVQGTGLIQDLLPEASRRGHSAGARPNPALERVRELALLPSEELWKIALHGDQRVERGGAIDLLWERGERTALEAAAVDGDAFLEAKVQALVNLEG